MKKKSLVYFATLLILSSFTNLKSQTLNYKGLYIDSFDGIVGNTLKEDSLLHFLKDSSFNSIICYRMSNVVSSTLSSAKNTTLASFIKRARTQFGIKNVIASSETYTTFSSLISPYNRSRTDSLERFNYYYLEFEFWNKNSTNPVSSSTNGYYCTNYLSPKGYTCDTSGAFKYYKKMLTSIDSLAAKDGIRSATYIGNPNLGQCKFIASKVDLLFCDNYTSTVSTIYTDLKTILSYLGSTSRTLQFVPIFASYSPGGTFLGDWLSKAPTGPHSEKSVYNNYFLPRYTAETGTWKSKLILSGYQWYRYSGMPRNGYYSSTQFCNPPSSISFNTITSNSAIAAWTAQSGSLTYNMKYRVSGTSTWSNPIAVTGTSVTLNGLNPATTYEIQLMSSCISSTSNYSSSTLFTTLSTSSCGAVSGLNATLITDITATLNWQQVSGTSNYSIQYRKVGVSTWTSTSASTTSKSISGLSASSIYEFQVKSNCTSGSSAFSASFLFSTTAPVCNAPVGLTATSITSNSALLQWTSVSGVSGYTINYRITGATSWISSNSTSNSFSLLALIPSSSYEYRVQTKCTSTNLSSFSIVNSFTTLTSTCATPNNVNASAATTNSFTVNWQASSSASSYRVQYRKVNSSSWTTVTTTNTYKNISSLTAATSYEFQVATVCSNGVSPYSAIGIITTLTNTTTCGIPTNLFASNIALTSVTLNWTSVSGASSYKVQYRRVGTTSWSSKTTSFTNKNISSLTSNITTPGATSTRLASSSTPIDSSSLANKEEINTGNSEILQKSSLIFFPNHTSNGAIHVKIQLSKKDDVRLILYDVLGNLVYENKLTTNEVGYFETQIIPSSELKIGVYVLVGISSTEKLTCKLILN
jgi:Fibronectin type III domain